MDLNDTLDSSAGEQAGSVEPAEVVKFRESFWGERATGYEVMLQNLRNSQNSVKEFIQFLRESAASEEQYVKQLSRVSAQVHKFRADSSMAPVWLNVLKELNEHHTWSHLKHAHALQELIKEADTYLKTLRAKKRKTKESELRTLEAVDRYRVARGQLTKCKDQYHLIAFELDKQQQLLRLNQLQVSTTSPATITAITNSIQKLEKKKQVCLDEYQAAIEKFNASRSEYVKRLEASSDVFQALEEQHLAQMRLFAHSYFGLLSKLNASKQRDFGVYHERLGQVYSSDFLLRELVRLKALGRERPVPAEFVDASTVTALKNSNYGTAAATSPIKFAARSENSADGDDLSSDNSSHLFSNASSSLNLNGAKLSVSLPQGNDSSSFSMVGPGYSVIADVSNASLHNLSATNGSNSNSNSQLLLESKRNSRLISMDFLSRRSKKGAESTTGQQQTSTPKKASSKLAQFAQPGEDSVSAASSITERVEATFGESMHELNQLEMEAKSKSKSAKELQDKSSSSALGGLFAKKLFGKQVDSPVQVSSPSSPSSTTKMAFIDSMTSQNEDEDFFAATFDDIDLNEVRQDAANSDMNNLYESSESSGDEKRPGNLSTSPNQKPDSDNLSNSDSDWDSDSDDSDEAGAPMKVMLRIKPKSEMTDRDQMVSPDVLRMISKNLILNSPSDKMLSSRSRALTSGQTPPPAAADGLARHPALTQRPQVPPRPKGDFAGSTAEFASLTSSATSASSTSRSASAVSFLNGGPHDLLASPNHFTTNSPATSSSSAIFSSSSSNSNSPAHLHRPAPPLPPLPAHIQEKFNEKQKLYMLRKELPPLTSGREPSPVQSEKRASLRSIETLTAIIEPVKYTAQLSSSSSAASSSSSSKRASKRIELRKLNLNLASDESVTEL